MFKSFNKDETIYKQTKYTLINYTKRLTFEASTTMYFEKNWFRDEIKRTIAVLILDLFPNFLYTN